MTNTMTSATSASVALTLMRPTVAAAPMPGLFVPAASRVETRQDRVEFSAEAKRLGALTEARSASLEARGAGSSEAVYGRSVQQRVRELLGEGTASQAAPAETSPDGRLGGTKTGRAAQGTAASPDVRGAGVTSLTTAVAATGLQAGGTATVGAVQETVASLGALGAQVISQAAAVTSATEVTSSLTASDGGATPASAPTLAATSATSNAGSNSAGEADNGPHLGQIEAALVTTAVTAPVATPAPATVTAPATTATAASAATSATSNASNAGSDSTGKAKKTDTDTKTNNALQLGQIKQAERGKTISIVA